MSAPVFLLELPRLAGFVAVTLFLVLVALAILTGALPATEHGAIWTGVVGREKLQLTVTTRLTAGHGRLECSTPEPPLPESASGGGRSLAFALYDLRLVLPEP